MRKKTSCVKLTLPSARQTTNVIVKNEKSNLVDTVVFSDKALDAKLESSPHLSKPEESVEVIDTAQLCSIVSASFTLLGVLQFKIMLI